jgi:hypothetical protein
LCGLQGSEAEILQHEKDASEHVEILATYISQIESTLSQLKDRLEVCLAMYFIVYSIFTTMECSSVSTVNSIHLME